MGFRDTQTPLGFVLHGLLSLTRSFQGLPEDLILTHSLPIPSCPGLWDLNTGQSNSELLFRAQRPLHWGCPSTCLGGKVPDVITPTGAHPMKGPTLHGGDLVGALLTPRFE